jgi:SAM-dependent methyltransferase
VEPELTIKVARREVRLYETPVSYHGRTYEEGKKIGLWDALGAAGTVLRFAFTHDIYKDPGPEVLHAFAGAPRFNRWMADTIRPYVGKRVLEIGAGIGNLTRLLVAGRTCYIAADLDEEHLARLHTRFQHRPNLQVRPCDLSRPADFEPFRGSMDSVICLNVLEHIEDDAGALRNIHSVLRPGGTAIVLVPCDQRIFGTLDAALGHFRRYAHEELRQKMESAGFRLERIIDFNRISRPVWYVSGKALERTAVSAWQLKLFDRSVWLWRRVDPVLPWGPTSIIGIGVKA